MLFSRAMFYKYSSMIIGVSTVLFSQTGRAEAAELGAVMVSPEKDQTFLVSPEGHTQQVLTNDVLTGFSPSRIEEVAVYLPNVQAARMSAGGSEDFIVRGFSLGGRILLDGVLGNQNFYIRDPATLERVEFIKGHASVLHGAGAPGGTVNYVSKKPSSTAQHSIQLGLGSEHYKRLVIDSTGPLNQQLDYRSILATTDSDTWKANVHDRQFTFMNTLNWRYQKNASLLATYELSRQTYPWDFDNVYANGEPVYDVSYVHPKTDAERVFHRLSFDWHHPLNAQTWFEAKTHFYLGDRDERQIGFYYLWDDNQPLVGFYQEVDEQFEQASTQVSLNHHYQWHQFEQLQGDWKVGIARNATHTRFDNRRAAGTFSLDIYNPSFDFALPTANQLTDRYGEYTWEEQALFVHNHTDITQNLSISFGARQTNYALKSYRNNTLIGDTEQSNRSVSGGVNWQLHPAIEIYASYSESFLPNIGTDRNENYFDAKQGEQKEIGVQFKPSQNLSAQLAYFDIEQTNLLTADPTDPDYKILAGSYVASGWELMLNWQASKQLSANLALGLLDAKVAENNDGHTGTHFPSVPKENASLWLNFKPSAHWKTQIGAVYQGKRAGDLPNSFYVDSYTRYDLAAQWQINPQTQLQASVQNLFDINYVSYSSAQDFVRFGEPRTLKLTLIHQF